jgi:hypothetical protein
MNGVLPPNDLAQFFGDLEDDDDWGWMVTASDKLIPDALKSAASQILSRARILSKGGGADRQLAVIFAQCACELQTEQMLDLLLQKEKSALAPLVRGLMGIRERDFASDKLRKVWRALGGTDLTVTTWWSAWIECRKLRNTVAHAGAPVSTEQAEQAVKSATDYIIHIAVTRPT